MIEGSCADDSIKYCGMLKIIPYFDAWNNNGEAIYQNRSLRIKNANKLLILFTAATDFNNIDPKKICMERLSSAKSKGFHSIKDDHIAEYSNLYMRMNIFLGKDNLYDYIPTNERLMRVSDGNIDNSLIALYYQYARYLLISSSRSNCELPANLQGIWNNMMEPPWGSRFTININTQMNYWIAEQSNLSECHKPLFRLIDRLKEKGRVIASQMYGCKGFVAHHNTNIWGDASPQDSHPTSTYWPMGAAWLCLHLWDHYEYTQDKEFLINAFPTMKEACEFFLDFLIADKEGNLVSCPSLSPENTYKTIDGYTTAICASPTMDHSILRTLFAKTASSAKLLGLDDKFIEEIQDASKRLPKLSINKNGGINEWLKDYDEVEIAHRHISHLLCSLSSWRDFS